MGELAHDLLDNADADAETKILGKDNVNYPCPLHAGLETWMKEQAADIKELTREQAAQGNVLGQIATDVKWLTKGGDRSENRVDKLGDREVNHVRREGKQDVAIAVDAALLRGLAWRVGIIAAGLAFLANVVVMMLLK